MFIEDPGYGVTHLRLTHPACPVVDVAMVTEFRGYLGFPSSTDRRGTLVACIALLTLLLEGKEHKVVCEVHKVT